MQRTSARSLARARLSALAPAFAFAGLVACSNADEGSKLPAWCDDTTTWESFEEALELELLEEVNLARERGRDCGALPVGAAGPVESSAALVCAARVHARDMSNGGIEGHLGSDGADTPARLESAGYSAWSFAELLDPEDTAAEDLVAQWLEDPPRCRELMRADLVEVGVGYANGAQVVLLAAPTNE